jgi:hypothetical protein
MRRDSEKGLLPPERFREEQEGERTPRFSEAMVKKQRQTLSSLSSESFRDLGNNLGPVGASVLSADSCSTESSRRERWSG